MKMARELFEREAFTLGKIGSHPQIPRLLDYFEEDSNFYLVQEFVDGETLKQEFERRGAFNEIEIKKILSEIFPALGFMHENGVIHRDIKPANIMRRKQDGQLVLIDFGAVSSQVNKPSADEDPSGLLTNFAIGTPGFAPPEQMAMRPVYSSDLYATAMSCLYLMTGRSPKDLPHDPYTGEINWKSQVKLSDRLRVVFEKLLQQSVAMRFRTAEEALRALESGTVADEAPKAYNQSVNIQQPSTPSSVTVRPANTQQAPNSRIQPQRYGSNQGTQFDSGMMTTGNTKAGGSSRINGELKGGRKVIVEYSQGKRNFANQDYSKAAFGSATLSGIVMSRSKLVEADFCHSDLSGASFQGANLSQAKLNGANLREAKMQRAVLVKADLGSASMILADLREANLQSAYMSKVDLSGANLSGANLKGAYLSQANLNGTNLCGADLKGAKISDEQLAQAKTNWGTIRPDGGKRLF
jgi:serine/threonine-protein kinase